jgi:hypothetical protein
VADFIGASYGWESAVDGEDPRVRAHGHTVCIWRVGARCRAGGGATGLCSSRGACTVTRRRKGNSPPG